MSGGVPAWVWVLTVAGFLGIVAFDLLVMARRREHVSTRGALYSLVAYVGLAVAFGVGLWLWGPGHSGPEFAAGYVTEYSLSVDNLFVFLLVMTRMQVPVVAQDRVLFIGIVLSLVMRAAFVLAGAAAISAASWTFYVLGGFLLYTAMVLAFEDQEEDAPDEHRVVAALRGWLPLTEGYHGSQFVVRVESRRVATPLVLAMSAIAVANVVFAVDSIPAIFGLTTNAFVVLAANAFALLGLRQVYFVVESLLTRLRFLKAGLVVILGFIGVKLILEAMWETHVRHLASWDVPQVSTSFSLAVIVGVLAVVTVASLAVDPVVDATTD